MGTCTRTQVGAVEVSVSMAVGCRKGKGLVGSNPGDGVHTGERSARRRGRLKVEGTKCQRWGNGVSRAAGGQPCFSHNLQKPARRSRRIAGGPGPSPDGSPKGLASPRFYCHSSILARGLACLLQSTAVIYVLAKIALLLLSRLVKLLNLRFQWCCAARTDLCATIMGLYHVLHRRLSVPSAPSPPTLKGMLIGRTSFCLGSMAYYCSTTQLGIIHAAS